MSLANELISSLPADTYSLNEFGTTTYVQTLASGEVRQYLWAPGDDLKAKAQAVCADHGVPYKG